MAKKIKATKGSKKSKKLGSKKTLAKAQTLMGLHTTRPQF